MRLGLDLQGCRCAEGGPHDGIDRASRWWEGGRPMRTGLYDASALSPTSLHSLLMQALKGK
jgi:hypothetical protein